MQIWVSDTQTSSHRLVTLHCEAHSDYHYLGDLDTQQLQAYLLEIDPLIDIVKNQKLLNYYGYLHLLVPKKRV